MQENDSATVYVVMINDRHSDPGAEVFTRPGDAIAYAKKAAKEYGRHPDDYEETEIPGWLFHATYSVEGDSVWVLEKTLHS